MNSFSFFRNPSAIKQVIKEIKSIPLKKEVNLMEVCGTHTMSIRKFGIDTVLPENVNLLSGPGCPVCVTPVSFIDTVIKLAEREDIIVATFGDMMKVPGTKSSLEFVKASGGRVEIVYSPMEGLNLAEKNKTKKIVFLSIGFETTVPTIGITIHEAKKRKLKNFFILEGNRLIPPAIEAVLEDSESRIDGFILPGHVCAVIGYKPFEFIPKQYGIPSAVAGFEPLDILLAVKSLLKMISQNRAEVINAYPRVVKYTGNKKAKNIIFETFKIVDALWRGLGLVKKSGLILQKEFKSFNILNHVNIGEITTQESRSCRCGDILKGKIRPYQCSLFGKGCTPISPKGPCMISSEGSCAAYYKYRHDSNMEDL